MTDFPDPANAPHHYRRLPTRRFFGWLIDLMFISLMSFAILPLTFFIGAFFFPFIFVVTGFMYRFLTLSGRSSTWGMRLMGIHFVEHDLHPMSAGTAFMHSVIYYLCWALAPLQILSAAMIVVTAHNQGFADKFMGTTALNHRAEY